jgi:small subunit ribosomal protein S18
MLKRKKRKQPITVITKDKTLTFSYKRFNELRRFISEQGSILPREKTGLTMKQQKRLAGEVKKARHLALLPFIQSL